MQKKINPLGITDFVSEISVLKPLISTSVLSSFSYYLTFKLTFETIMRGSKSSKWRNSMAP